MSVVLYCTFTNFFALQALVIRNTAYRPSTQASYMIGSRMTKQENQPAAQNAARHNIFSQMASYMSGIFMELVEIDPGVSRLGDEIVGHNSVARQLTAHL